MARAIADSPLVKTAIYGRDANWGRVVQAAGAALSSDGRRPLLCDVAFAGIELARRCRPLRLEPDEELRLTVARPAPRSRRRDSSRG